MSAENVTGTVRGTGEEATPLLQSTGVSTATNLIEQQISQRMSDRNNSTWNASAPYPSGVSLPHAPTAANNSHATADNFTGVVFRQESLPPYPGDNRPAGNLDDPPPYPVDDAPRIGWAPSVTIVQPPLNLQDAKFPMPSVIFGNDDSQERAVNATFNRQPSLYPPVSSVNNSRDPIIGTSQHYAVSNSIADNRQPVRVHPRVEQRGQRNFDDSSNQCFRAWCFFFILAIIVTVVMILIISRRRYHHYSH